MNLLIEAFYISSTYITGIERHFTLQLQIINRIDNIKKIIVVSNKYFNFSFNNFLSKKDVQIIKIDSNTVHNWRKIYKENRIDIIYSTFTLPPILPEYNCTTFYVLHDPGRYLFPKLMEKSTLDSNNLFFKKFIERKNFHVITVSYSSKQDIIDLFPCLKERIHVVYNFVSESLLKLARKINLGNNSSFNNTDYFLTVGRFSPTKNTINIVKAFEQRDASMRDFKLIIVGRQGWYSQLESYLKIFMPENVIVLDSIEDEQLVELYKNCYGIISASLYEGFCMPLIEAIYCGCPRVFCSDIAVFHEINHFGFIFFNQNNVNDMVTKVFTTKYKNNNLCKINSFNNEPHFTIDESYVQFAKALKKVNIYE